MERIRSNYVALRPVSPLAQIYIALLGASLREWGRVLESARLENERRPR